METPPNTPTPAPYFPDPAKSTLDNLYGIAARLASGSASESEREFYNANKLEHWDSWDKPADAPAADPKPANNPTPAQTPPADVKALAVTADEAADRLAGDFGKLFTEIDAHAASIFETERQRLRDAGASDPDGNAKALADAAKDTYRKEVFAKHQPRLLGEISKLQAHEKTAADRAMLTDNLGDKPSSLNLATLAGLGTDERQKYASQLAGMNPASLRAVALQAQATGNRVLAAAVKVANDALPKESRVFSSTQLADALFGQEALEIWQSAVLTRNAVQRTIAMLRQLESGRSNPVAKISRGLAARSAGKMPPMPNPGDKLGDNTSISRISRGLRAMAATEGGDGE